MPTYLYERPDGKGHEVVVETVKEMEARAGVYVNAKGETCRRDIGEEHRRSSQAYGRWPILSESLGVMPGQQKAAMEQARRAGCPTDFTKDGRAIVTSERHRRALCKSLGFTVRQ